MYMSKKGPDQSIRADAGCSAAAWSIAESGRTVQQPHGAQWACSAEPDQERAAGFPHATFKGTRAIIFAVLHAADAL